MKDRKKKYYNWRMQYGNWKAQVEASELDLLGKENIKQKDSILISGTQYHTIQYLADTGSIWKDTKRNG